MNTPFDMPQIKPPTFPDRTVDIRDHGAVGDGKTMNTKAFADAIAACNKAGGGTVLVPAGTWLTGAIQLRTNINLHLEKGAEIRFSTNFDGYLPVVFTRMEGIECYNYSALIYANGCTNIAITGAGKLDGQGQAWWHWRKQQKDAVRTLYETTRGIPVKDRIFGTEQVPMRPSFVQPINCRNVLIEGITVGSGPMWTIHPVYCENVIIRNVTVSNKGPNNDGIDPDSCRNVLIEYCNFDTAADAIGIKSGLNEDGWRVGKPCENIVIRHCRFGLGKPCDGVLSIGSEMSGGVRNVFIHDCHFEKTVRGIRIKSMRGRGAFVENVWIQDITTGPIGGEPILINTFYKASTVQPFLTKPPVFRNIHVKNITCEKAKNAIQIIGLPEQPIENVTIENLNVSAEKGAFCSDVKGLVLKNINIQADKGPIVRLKDSRDVTIQKATCPAGTEVFLKLEGEETKNIKLMDNDLSDAREDVVLGEGVPADAVVRNIQHFPQRRSFDLSAIKSPIILRGDETTAYRDPACIYHDGVFRVFYTYNVTEADGKTYWFTAFSKSRDLIHWTEPKTITPKDRNLNFASPGNIIRYGDDWILCLQTYPTPKGEKYGNENCRVWIMRSKDLENWGPAEMLMVKGPDVPIEKMGRLIDAYLIEDKDEPGKWWCFFDDNAANMSYSYDLKTWTYFNRIEAGENVCILVDRDEYLMFHSPKNGIGMKRSKDLKTWRDVGGKTTKGDAGPITLGQKDWPWASQRLTAGFVLDLSGEPRVGKYLMFFHAEPPGGFKKYACLGIAWSDDLIYWNWPGKTAESQ